MYGLPLRDGAATFIYNSPCWSTYASVICWRSTRSKILQSETASPRWEPLPSFQNTKLTECGGTWSHFFLLTWRLSLPTSRLLGLAHHLGLLSSATTCGINTTLHCSGSHGPPTSPKDGITDSTRCSPAPTQRCGRFLTPLKQNNPSQTSSSQEDRLQVDKVWPESDSDKSPIRTSFRLPSSMIIL